MHKQTNQVVRRCRRRAKLNVGMVPLVEIVKQIAIFVQEHVYEPENQVVRHNSNRELDQHSQNRGRNLCDFGATKIQTGVVSATAKVAL